MNIWFQQIIPRERLNEKQIDDDIQLNENNNDENFLKAKQATPKKLRRSASFSEGQRTPVKSAYNKENDKYETHQSPFDKPDIVYSKREQIQVIRTNLSGAVFLVTLVFILRYAEFFKCYNFDKILSFFSSIVVKGGHTSPLLDSPPDL